MQSKYRQWNLSQLKARWVPKKWQRSRKSPRNCHHRGEPTGWRRKREEIEETSDLHWSLCIPNIPCIMDGQHTPAERDWYTEHLSVMKTEIRLNQQSDNSFLNENDLHFCPLHITRSRIHLGSKPEPQRSNLKGKKNGWKRSEQQLSCSRSYCKLLTLERALYLELTKCGNTIVTGIRPKKFHGNYETVMQVECTKIFSSGGILKIHPKASQVKHVPLSVTEIKIDGKNRGWGMVLKPEMLEQPRTWGHQER